MNRIAVVQFKMKSRNGKRSDNLGGMNEERPNDVGIADDDRGLCWGWLWESGFVFGGGTGKCGRASLRRSGKSPKRTGWV